MFTSLPPSDPTALRLALGPLTDPDVAVAQSAIHQALDVLQARHGWHAVPTTPTPALLLSMAVRLDHALGLPGYYDELAGFRLAPDPSLLPAQGTDDPYLLLVPDRTHEQILARTLETARLAHLQLAQVPVDLALLLAPVTQAVVVQATPADATPQERSLIAAAVGHVLAHPSTHGLLLLPSMPTEAHLEALAGVLQARDLEQGLSPGLTVEACRPLWLADAQRLYEEVSGTGFHRPG